MQRLETRPHPTQGGFTLIELVAVIVITGIMAATLTVFFRPAMDSYVAVRARADLVEQGDTALRRMIRDVRTAVPNSIRIPNNQCFEFVPTIAGGRFRAERDTVNDDPPAANSEHCSAPSSTCSAPLNITQPASAFDVLTPFSTVPAAGDEVVIGNATPDWVYAGSNRAVIQSVTVPPAYQGRYRITLTSPRQFPASYGEAHFTVTPASGPVFYVCSGATGVDASGNGTGTLRRLSGHGWNAGYPSACPDVSSAPVLAAQVASCEFVYAPNQGATQQNGFISLRIKLSRNQESTTLVFGAHVANTP